MVSSWLVLLFQISPPGVSGRAGKNSSRQAKFQPRGGGGGQVSRLKKKTPEVEKVPGWVGCFWGPLLGLKNCMAHS